MKSSGPVFLVQIFIKKAEIFKIRQALGINEGINLLYNDQK